MVDGINVMCIYCKTIKFIPTAEAAKLKEPPICEKDGGVMIAHSAGKKKSR